MTRPRILFVTGRLAEPALRRTLEELAPRAGFDYQIATLKISVAALMTPAWVARHLPAPQGVERIVVPGHCGPDLTPIAERTGLPVEQGPKDLLDLPGYFGQAAHRPSDYGGYDIEILAEINHAPRLSRHDVLALAEDYRAAGADVIDVGCDPGQRWAGAAETIQALRDQGHRVSIDSFDPYEVEAAVSAGAELVLSVNSSNVDAARSWGAEVVAIPDVPTTLEGLDTTLERLDAAGVRHRIDPVLEPIGFGFAASLGRFIEVRRRYPTAEMLMGVGNLTELTDVDSAGVNVVLLGACQELGIRSVLTTAVINWARSSVRELDLARRLVHYAVQRHALPKHLEPRLVVLRDVRVREYGQAGLEELARRITDPNYRIFAERGAISVMNGSTFLQGTDPFELFQRLGVNDPAHAFYLGWEMMKAATALTLSKTYTQDQSLDWGFLTRPEESRRADRGPRMEDRSSKILDRRSQAEKQLHPQSEPRIPSPDRHFPPGEGP